MIGRPGAGILQMNGQPTAQNTRETRLQRRPARVPQLAERGARRRAGAALERRAGADPALGAADARDGDLPLRRAGLDRVSLDQRHQPGRVAARTAPGSGRSSPRTACSSSSQDAFLTETARLADVVLPAALWGEKTGTFTNADRTVHLSEQAVDPPGEARADLDIFARLRAAAWTSGQGRQQPLVKWSTPEAVLRGVEASARRGRPCDYTGLTYDKLRGGTGIQWPCNERGARRDRAALHRPAFPTLPGRLRGLRPRHRHGRDVHRSRVHGRSAPTARAILKAAEWTPPHEWAGRRVSVHADDRPHGLPLPHAHEDRPHAGTAGRRARAMGRAVPC